MFATFAAWMSDLFRWFGAERDDAVARAERAHEAFLRVATPPDDMERR